MKSLVDLFSSPKDLAFAPRSPGLQSEPPAQWLGLRRAGNPLRAPWWLAGFAVMMLRPVQAHASIFKGEALDNLANVLAWVVLVVAPAVGIAAFWIVHILPEKIAEKKQHPQAKAIQCLCLLSLVFGGLLWPIAWLWAYSKPVLYKLAYGTDKVPHGHEDQNPSAKAADGGGELKQLVEVELLQQRVAELEAKLATKTAEGGKV